MNEYSNIKRSLHLLFEEWEDKVEKEKHVQLLRDGCIDLQQYAQTQPKVVFLIDTPKDIHPMEKIDERFMLAKEQPASSALHTCSEWAYGILYGFPPYDMVSSDARKKRYALHSVAFCYVYKILQDTPDKDLLLFAEKYHMYLRRQLEYLAADIIVCSLQWNKALWRLILDKENVFVDSGYEIPLCRLGNSKLIDFYHPRTQLPGVMTYCLLEKVVNSYAFFKL